MKQVIIGLLLLSLTTITFAQNNNNEKEPFSLTSELFTKKLDNQVAVVFGLGQLLAGGFNVEGNFMYNRFIFDYSHGIQLTSPNASLEPGADQNQGLSIHLPWTTGFGLGYRFTKWLNLRVEPKWHRYELYYDGEARNGDNRIGAYTTFTLGLGLYANIRPFGKMNNFLRGITIVPNLRWWPRVASTLENDQLEYYNKQTGQNEVHQARQIGMSNSPFFINISIGYSITF